MNPTIELAFLAGLASFLSPCVFPLVPAYIGYLSGRTIASNQTDKRKNRWLTITHGIAFILGFSVVFVGLAIAIAAVGYFLKPLSQWLARIGGIIVVIFGLQLTGIIKIPFLEVNLKAETTVNRRLGYLSSFFMGIIFSLGWSPCVGPVLGSIYMIVMINGSYLQGVQLLIAYSMGLAVPFLFAALGLGWVTGLIKKHSATLRYIQIVMGGILIILGLLLVFGLLEQMARISPIFNFGI